MSGRIWRSETTGKAYRVQVERERLTADWVNVPREYAKHGALIHSEALLSGSKWIGVSHSYLPCAAGNVPKDQITGWCHLMTRIEFESVSADRITGRGETLKKFDCGKCRILETGWSDFVWAPKR